jgi:uncharacterized protein YndB with AHSA1/START domain
MNFTLDIARPAADVFAVIADLSGYHRWLRPSRLYVGTTRVSGVPTALGTTYVDRTQQAILRGRVTQFHPPELIAFQQVTRSPLGRLAVDIVYRLEEQGTSTRVYRTTSPHLSGPLVLIGPLLLRSIRSENLRTLAAMKDYLEHATS